MSAVDAKLTETARPASAPGAASAKFPALESERYWTVPEYAFVLGKTVRWVEDHCVRYGDIYSSLVGRERRFSPKDRAKNAALFEVHPELLDDEPETPAPTGFQIPTDPAELSKLLADVRRVQVPQHA